MFLHARVAICRPVRRDALRDHRSVAGQDPARARACRAISVSRPAISRHLKVLKAAGLVREERRGRENVYALDRSMLKALSAWLELYWGARLDTLAIDPAPEIKPEPKS